MISFEKKEKLGLMWRISLDAANLALNYPPQFINGHKKWIYSQISLDSIPPQGFIRIARWQSLPIPFPVDISPSVNEGIKIQTDPGFFKYDDETSGLNDGEKIWYLNFADRNLFGFYQGPLFAQDEMQVMEHPILGSVRAWLEEKSLTDPKFHPNTQDANGSPTPFLIMGVERRAKISTNPDINSGRPDGLYGKNFMKASLETIQKATEIFNPPVKSNILSLSAISQQRGKYTKFQINKLFSTLYTGFIAARIESQLSTTIYEKPIIKVIIHTGNWGCGAFGGNPILTALIQLIAAHSAGIDSFIYHPVYQKEQFLEALKIYETSYKSKISSRGPIGVINDLESLGFEWGVSDGN